MCERTDSCSRVILWCWSMRARGAGWPATPRRGRRRCTSGRRCDAPARSAPRPARSRGPPAAARRALCAASFICSYSSRRRTSSARGSSALLALALRPRQQHARLDLDQHRRHQQVFGGEFQLLLAHHLDVLQVLARELRHRDVEDVEVGCGSGRAAGRAGPRRSRGKPTALREGCTGRRAFPPSARRGSSPPGARGRGPPGRRRPDRWRPASHLPVPR